MVVSTQGAWFRVVSFRRPWKMYGKARRLPRDEKVSEMQSTEAAVCAESRSQGSVISADRSSLLLVFLKKLPLHQGQQHMVIVAISSVLQLPASMPSKALALCLCSPGKQHQPHPLLPQQAPSTEMGDGYGC